MTYAERAEELRLDLSDCSIAKQELFADWTRDRKHLGRRITELTSALVTALDLVTKGFNRTLYDQLLEVLNRDW